MADPWIIRTANGKSGQWVIRDDRNETQEPTATICIGLLLLAFFARQSALASTTTPIQSPAPQDRQLLTANPPTIIFEDTTHDLGKIGFGVTNTCEFRFTNAGRADLKITRIKKTCGCTVAELAKQDYAPGESGFVGSPRVQPRCTSGHSLPSGFPPSRG